MTGNQTLNEPEVQPARKPGLDVVRLVTLSGVLALIVVSFLIWRSIDRIEIRMDSRLARIENRLEQVSGKADTVAERNQPPRRGPDPTRVYAVNTVGAPAEGPARAPITIVEFSDFQ